jgi:hypothetical protein
VNKPPNEADDRTDDERRPGWCFLVQEINGKKVLVGPPMEFDKFDDAGRPIRFPGAAHGMTVVGVFVIGPRICDQSFVRFPVASTPGMTDTHFQVNDLE